MKVHWLLKYKEVTQWTWLWVEKRKQSQSDVNCICCNKHFQTDTFCYFFSFSQCILEFELNGDSLLKLFLLNIYVLLQWFLKGRFCFKYINNTLCKRDLMNVKFNKNDEVTSQELSFVQPGFSVLLLWHFLLKDVCNVTNYSSLVLAVFS